jgi:alpha-ketoglutarate-dependent taurine dioxygenase
VTDLLAQRIAGLSTEKRKLFEQLLARGNNASSPEKIARQGLTRAVPLSFAQQRIWFLDQLEPGSPLYNIPTAMRLNGPLLVPILKRALNEIIRRHESLRTIFEIVKEQPVQNILPELDLPLPVRDLRELPARMRERELEKVYADESASSFSLERGPLLRAMLLRMSDEEHVLILTKHHIVSDGWSIHLFFRELTKLYEAYAQDAPSPLAELPIQYADFALWQREWLRGEVLEKQLAYWREQLGASIPPLRLQGAGERRQTRGNVGQSLPFMLSEELSADLKALSQREGVTLFMLLLAAFQTLLYRYSGQEQFTVGTDVAGRRQSETESLIGFFANQLVLRAWMGGNPTFQDCLQRVKKICLEAYAHQDVPFEKLVEELQPERDLSRHPLFQIKFVFWQSPMLPSQSNALTFSPLEFERGTAKFDLTLFAADAGTHLTGSIEYHADLFQEVAVKKMQGHLRAILEAVVREPGARLDALEMLTSEEKERQLMDQKKRQVSRHELFKRVKPKAVSIAPREVVKSELSFDASLPLCFEPQARGALDLADWARANLLLIEEKLSKHGALLFRNFTVNSVKEFENFAAAVCPSLFHENGEHPRKSVSGKVYTPVFYPPDRQLLWHNENSFNHRWPMKIFFGCLRPADEGGETPLVDSRQVYERLPPELRDEFRSKKIMYVRNYGGGLGLDWQTVFNTSSRAEVEAHCRNALMSWEWKEGDRLKTTCVRPAVIPHPKTGQLSWFNQAQHWHVSCLDQATRESITRQFALDDYPRHCYFGDGTNITDEMMNLILKAYASLEVVFAPRKGDVLLVDNVATAHARKPFAGPREVLVSMGEMMSFEEISRTHLTSN